MRLLRRPLLLLFLLAAFAATLGWGLFLRERTLNDVEQQNRQLREMVARLATEYRVADVTVLAQSGPRGRQRTTTFRFQEYDRDGTALEPRTLTIAGDVAYFDALVLKFDDAYVGAGDPLRGRSLHLFRRAFGEYQAPADGFPLEAADADGIPAAFRQGMGEFEADLWKHFWELAADPDRAAERGVRVAQGEAVYVRLEPGRTWRLTIEADGGLNIRPSAVVTARQ